MPSIVVIDSSGNEKATQAQDGRTVMEIIRDAGYDEMLALCGGCCSCATCHVHVDPAYAQWLDAMSDDEDDLLDAAPYRDSDSRLSCQLRFSPALDRMRVRLVPAD